MQSAQQSTKVCILKVGFQRHKHCKVHNKVQWFVFKKLGFKGTNNAKCTTKYKGLYFKSWVSKAQTLQSAQQSTKVCILKVGFQKHKHCKVHNKVQRVVF